jgi:hypothetical protein
MKKTVFVLFALLSLVSFAQATAQTTQTPPMAAPVPSADAQFLATLSGGQAETPDDLAPSPSFMAGCTSTSQCATGQLCCYVCGNPPATGFDTTCRACVTPVRGRCPLVV